MLRFVWQGLGHGLVLAMILWAMILWLGFDWLPYILPVGLRHLITLMVVAITQKDAYVFGEVEGEGSMHNQRHEERNSVVCYGI